MYCQHAQARRIATASAQLEACRYMHQAAYACMPALASKVQKSAACKHMGHRLKLSRPHGLRRHALLAPERRLLHWRRQQLAIGPQLAPPSHLVGNLQAVLTHSCCVFTLSWSPAHRKRLCTLCSPGKLAYERWTAGMPSPQASRHQEAWASACLVDVPQDGGVQVGAALCMRGRALLQRVRAPALQLGMRGKIARVAHAAGPGVHAEAGQAARQLLLQLALHHRVSVCPKA
jgi:hypothetical protein